MSLYRVALALFTLAMLTSCATTPKPALLYPPGSVVDSLTAGVSMSLHTSDRSMAGTGFMVYRRPDRVHMIMLSPFGTTLFEVFALGNRITLVYPSQGIAYSGSFDELPNKGGLQGWRLMRWVMDADPPGPSKPNGTFERLSSLGGTEKVTIEQGLITSKSNRVGEHVSYGDYSLVNGVPLASEIDIHNSQDDRIRLKLQEPEVNMPLEDSTLTPRLDGLKILPLSAIEGL